MVFDRAAGASHPGTGIRHEEAKPEHAAGQLLAQGMELEQQGKPEQALQCYDTAIGLMPGLARAHFNRGIILLDRGDAREALQALSLAVQYKPDSAGAHFNMGVAHTRLDHHEAAVKAYRQAIALKPDFAEAQMALGAALEELGQDEEAITSYRRALEIKLDYVEAHDKLVSLLSRLGRSGDLAAIYRRMLELEPDNVEVLYNLGMVLRQLGRAQEAAGSFRRAVELRPSFVDALCNLGDVSIELRLFDDAMESYRKVLQFEPENAGVHQNLAAALKEVGRLVEALESYRRAISINPDFPIAHSNLLLIQHLLSKLSVEQHVEEARRFGAMVARLAPPAPALSNLADPSRCLRIGFVSGDLHSHPVGHFIESVLAALSTQASGRLELFAYSNSLKTDDLTDRIKPHFRHWRSVVGQPDEATAQRIRDDQIDILIDLSGHTGKNRLPVFARKPAPVQISWLGYFATTGVAAIDYLIADPWTLPPELESHFTEAILRLPETRLCFTPPAHDVDVAPLPVLRNGYVTFACFNTLSKMNDAVVALWARVLHAVPGSRLQLVAPPDQQVHMQRVIAERYAAHGITADRLQVLNAGPRAAYLATYQQVDIALDPFPYTGGTTTAEALWMGVPVLTLAGKSFLSRQGVGLMMNAGMPEWIAENADDYVKRAVSHAGDLPRLAALRAGMRKRVLASPVFDAVRFAGHFEAALRDVWQEWCEAQSGSRA